MFVNIFEYPTYCSPQLIPSTAFGSNIRAVVSDKQWKEIREQVFSIYGKVCKFCFAKPKSLDCHEIWKYEWNDESTSGVQSLVAIYPLCKMCHSVCHIGFWSLKGDVSHIVQHMARVRKISKAEAQIEINHAFAIHDKLSKLNWELSIENLSFYIKGNKYE